MPEPPCTPGRSHGQQVTEAIAKLQAYRAQLKKAGRLIEARAVEHCITLVRKASK